VFDLVGCTAPPPGGGSVALSATETQRGPDVCVKGTGLPVGAHATSEFFGIPGRTAPFAGNAGNVRADGTLDLGVDSNIEFLVASCSSTQVNSTVQIIVTLFDANSNELGTASDNMLGAFWCDGDAP
jgi:hypothetical protein